MKKGYLINNTIEFWPQDNKIISHEDVRNNFILTGPAARCFLLLIENAPDIVSQNLLFQRVWGDDGMYVQTNTLYQSISLIRRGIKSITADDAIISTIPKKGFQIKSDILISEISLPTVDVNAPLSLNSSDTTEPSLILGEEFTFGVNNKSKRNNVFTQRYKIFYLIILAVFVIVGFIWYKTSNQNDNFLTFFASYKLVGEFNGCHVMANSDTVSWQEGVKQFDINLNCKLYPWVYITVYKYIPTRTLIGCNKPFFAPPPNGKISCVSVLVRGLDIK